MREANRTWRLDVESHYLRYGPMVLRRCRTLLRDPAKAEDAMQDVFVSLIRSEDRLRDEAPGALLLRIATNVCLNRLRGERRRPEDAHDDDDLALRIAQADDGAAATRSRGRWRAACSASCSAATIRWRRRRAAWRSCTWSTA